MYKFTVPGRPVPKGRPRVAEREKYVLHPEATKVYEEIAFNGSGLQKAPGRAGGGKIALIFSQKGQRPRLR